ncbi:MAG TPA: bifunctional phosphoribosylaminoimidazolecarboxamide formyltransferase/IMP cyclohydrolase [Actinomycetota bacterium]|nr:bifunctional phosphoribosylaminoimidazolecarboxamide formyltransferase/IMP cyclohydrolase [Actinomycetota bacterium]
MTAATSPGGRLSVRRALLSVSDKAGVAELATELASLGVEIVSTGSTAEAIEAAGVSVTTVADVTGFPEMMGGRVKTLHPAIHAGILADRHDEGHMREIEERGIAPFDLVVVNLYPFESTVAAGGTRDAVIEQIDIGGPALVRAAAKNFRSVAVVVRPDRYGELLAAVRDGGGVDERLRLRLAEEAFALVAVYDAAIASWFAELVGDDEIPRSLTLGLQRTSVLRYGENPHQRAALYRAALSHGPLGGADVLQGKEMSFNNWLDAEAARALASALDSPAAVIVKHNNPCGAAVANTAADAYRAAYECDPVSAFGGVVAFNAPVDAAATAAMADVFTEVVVAPAFTDGALSALTGRKNLRVVRAAARPERALDVRAIEGGALVQDPDEVTERRDAFEVVTRRAPDDDEWEDLLFAWRVCARVKSNAIVLARLRRTVGVGAGQMSRVDAVDIACRKAGERAAGARMASDAFFPFRDGVDRAAEAGVTAVIHPGGSMRDEEVVEAADAHGMAMVLTGRRHFRH